MKKTLLFLFTIVSLPFSYTKAQCSETAETKVLLIGDSWANFMLINQTFNNAFKNWGHSNFKFVSNTVISENGAQTDDFFKPEKQDSIRSLLLRYPSIEVVHVSIGGNDVLGDWRKSFTIAERDTLAAQVSRRIIQIFDFIRSVRPGIRIVWSGYTYTNFEEIISSFPLPTSHPFYNTWNGMEQPSNFEINTTQNYFSDLIKQYTDTVDDVDYVLANGLMQYVYGQTSPLGVAPGGTYPPKSVSIPYGDVNYPSAIPAMGDYGIFKDCFHLSPSSYLAFIEYQTQKFYHKFLMDDLYLLSENNNQTGSVSSNGAVSSSLFLGEQGGENFSTHLSFNTANMADTSLSRASIFLRRESLTGTLPISGSLEVKIKSGNFGASADVEASDYSASGDGNGTPCLFGNNTGDGKWIRLDLPASLYPYINKNNPVQFIISAPGFTGGKVTFSGSSDPDYAPVLNLLYFDPTVGFSDLNAENGMKVYPNPTRDILAIDYSGDINNVEVLDMLGRKCKVTMNDERTINVQSLQTGSYILKIATANGTSTTKFVKE